jgi:hypothetical protein
MSRPVDQWIGTCCATSRFSRLTLRNSTTPRRPGLLVYSAHALPKRGLEIRWPTVLAEEIGEGLVDELLEVLHADRRDLPVPVHGACVRARLFDHAGSPKRLRWRSWTYCLPLHRQRRHRESVFYRGSMSVLHVPLPMLRRHPRGCLRTAWGRCGSLFLHRSGHAPPTPCRSPAAPVRKRAAMGASGICSTARASLGLNLSAGRATNPKPAQIHRA